MSKNTREKLSDAYRDGRQFLVPRVPFAEAYPEIESIRVEVAGAVYDERRVPAVMDCPNPRCYRGGVQIDQIIRMMVLDRQTEKDGVELCVGYLGSPKGRRQYGPCLERFPVRVSIRYREAAAEAS
jgi:hypothetical protein